MIRLYEDGTIIKTADSPGRNLRGGAIPGCIKKTFEIKAKHKRLIRSSAIRQALTAKYKILFCTLTFPREISQYDANKCFSNFVDNLKTNYKLHSYVAVKENTKRGRPHYHCLFDLPFTDFKKLNRAWIRAISDYMPGSNNAFTTGRNPIVSDVHLVARYISKYITKAKTAQETVKPTTRQYFLSENIAARPGVIDWNTLIYLLTKRKYSLYQGDFFTVYKIHDFAILPEKLTTPKRPPPKKPPKQRQIIDRSFPELMPNMGLNYRVINSH